MNSAPHDLTWRIGGPLGRHATRVGVWFEPALWTITIATITWVLLFVRQAPCQQKVYGQVINPFVRLCYSDTPLLYQGRGIATGAGIYSQVPLEYPVLTGYFIMFGRWLTDLFGGVVGPQASGQQQLDASYLFFVVCAVLLFVCFLVTVLVHVRLGADSASRLAGEVPVRAWDAWLVAAAPVVLASGLINFDMLAVALTALGLLAWARSRPVLSGVAIGLAFAAKFYPIVLLPALLVLCLRSGTMRAFWRWLGAVVVCWVGVNLPVMCTALTGWTAFWVDNRKRGADLGSLWYVLSLMGVPMRQVNLLAAVFMLAGGAGVIWAVVRAPRRPRLAQVALLFLIVFLVFNKVYSPQYSLWLLPLIVLARPKVVDWVVWNIAEVAYWASVWGFLEGVLGIGSGADVVYWLATIMRICVQVWIALRVLADMWSPWDDPVRRLYVDDPLGGVFDHAPDAAWVVRASAGQRP